MSPHHLTNAYGARAARAAHKMTRTPDPPLLLSPRFSRARRTPQSLQSRIRLFDSRTHRFGDPSSEESVVGLEGFRGSLHMLRACEGVVSTRTSLNPCLSLYTHSLLSIRLGPLNGQASF